MFSGSGCEPLPVSPNSLQVKEHQDAWVVTFCHPGHRLVGSAAVYCDGFKWNDTAPTCVGNTLFIVAKKRQSQISGVNIDINNYPTFE